MDFTEAIIQFSKKIKTISESITTEEATKTSLIMPIFNYLGYDVFNPLEFCPEYTADVGIKKGEKIDYAILNDGEPLILIECKSCTENLDKYSSQLFRYFGTTTAKFGILTNGIIYRFYTDLEEANKMDLVPFLEVDLLNLKEAAINEFKKFSKENFDTEKIFSTAEELKYSNLIKAYLQNELENPSDEFVKTILSNVYDGAKTQKVIEKYRILIKKAFTSFINEAVNKKISTALKSTEEPTQSETIEEVEESKIVTTELELEAFYMIRGLLAGNVPVEDITYKDTERYFSIIYKNNTWKPICRLNLDSKNKSLFLPDENKKYERHYIDTLNDLYEFKNDLIEIVNRYM